MTVYALDSLRGEAWENARAAREAIAWEAALVTRNMRPRTRLHYAYTVTDLLEAHPEKTADEFNVVDVEMLLAGYPDKGRDTRRAHLSSFFTFLYKRQLIPKNPMDFLEVPRRRRKSSVHDIFDDAEEVALCGLELRDGALMTVMLQAALRKEECRKLQRRHVNLDRNELAVLNSKFEKSRVVPITPKLHVALSDLFTLEGLDRDDHLWYSIPGGRHKQLGGGWKGTIQRRFVSPDGIGETTFARWFRRCVDEAGVRYRKPHMTRHTRLTKMRRLGYDLDEIQLFAGHESIQTTKDQYVHTDIYDVAARMAELEAIA